MQNKEVNVGENINSENTAPQATKNSKVLSFLSSAVREALAILCWGYGITKLFLFDIDIFIIEKFFPSYSWIVTYKFFILIGLSALIWLVTKNKQILIWSLYIVFYPLIILLWKIPVFIFKKKSWNLAFAFLDSIISFFRSFKRTFITTSLFLVSAVIAIGVSNRVLLWFSITVLTGILFFVYLQRILLVFKPSGIYQILGGFLISGGNNIRNTADAALEKINQQTSIEKMEEAEVQQWVTQLQQVVLHNRACLFLAKGLKSYQDTGWKIVSDVFAILILVFYTIFSFAVINFALFKINPHLYAFPTPPSFFQFFYYSFNVLIFNQIQEVVAITPISQIASMIEAFFALFLIAIFVSLVLTFRSQKDADELRDVIKELTKEGQRMEAFIRDRYHMDGIDIALETLRKFKSAFIDLLYMLTEATK